jgi:branched-chain amino acid transport system ATP-binding protein
MLIDTFKRLVAEEGVAVLLVEQNLGAATAVCERQLAMVSGQIAVETTAAALLADPEAQRRYLGVEPLQHD